MTPPLGDHFPENIRSGSFDRFLIPGAVFRNIVPFTDPPKIKRFVILGFNDGVASLGILIFNSEINHNVLRSAHLQSLQLPLEVEDRTFLEHDSFLDCSAIFEKSIEDLRSEYLADTGICLGCLSDVDLLEARRLASTARTIERKLKLKYGLI